MDGFINTPGVLQAWLLTCDQQISTFVSASIAQLDANAGALVIKQMQNRGHHQRPERHFFNVKHRKTGAEQSLRHQRPATHRLDPRILSPACIDDGSNQSRRRPRFSPPGQRVPGMSGGSFRRTSYLRKINTWLFFFQ